MLAAIAKAEELAKNDERYFAGSCPTARMRARCGRPPGHAMTAAVDARAVSPVPSAAVERWASSFGRRHGCTEVAHVIELTGVCATCRTARWAVWPPILIHNRLTRACHDAAAVRNLGGLCQTYRECGPGCCCWRRSSLGSHTAACWPPRCGRQPRPSAPGSMTCGSRSIISCPMVFCPSSATLAAYVLGRTGRVAVGTAVSVLSTQHPVALAERAALLDQVSGGRFWLGVDGGLGGPGGVRHRAGPLRVRFRRGPRPAAGRPVPGPGPRQRAGVRFP